MHHLSEKTEFPDFLYCKVMQKHELGEVEK